MTGRRLFKNFRRRKGKKELASASVAKICASIQEVGVQFRDHLPTSSEQNVLIRIDTPNDNTPFHGHYFGLENLVDLLYESFIFSYLAGEFTDHPMKDSSPVTTMKDHLQILQTSAIRTALPPAFAKFLQNHGEHLFWFSSLLEELSIKDETYKTLCLMTSDAAKEDLKVIKTKKWSTLLFFSLFRRGSEINKTTLLLEKVDKRLPKLFDSPTYTKKQDLESQKPYQRKSSIKKCVSQYRDMNRKPSSREQEDDSGEYYDV